MSIGLGGSANASVGVDGSASAGASVDGGIGGSLAGALGGSLSAGIGLAGSLALSASASLAASASFSAGFSFGSSGPAPVLGARPPDILPNYKFMVQFQSLGPMRFQSISGIVATQTMAAPPTPTPPAGPANSAAHSTGPGARNNTAHPAPAAPPASQGVSAASTTHVGQGGAGGSATRLPSGNWTWTDLTLKRGVAKDGLALTNWIMAWLKSNRAPRLDLTVIVLDLEGKPAMTWHFKQTFPTTWTLPDLTAAAPGAYIDVLKVAFDGSPELILG